MNAIDFEYDDQLASSWQLRICEVDSMIGIVTSTAGSEINFNQVSLQKGALWFTTDTTYDSVLEANFQVCKYDKNKGIVELDIDEQRSITRWLNRDEPHKLRLISIDNSYDYVLFEGSFNLQKIETRSGVIGYELHFVSNRPFAIGETVKRRINMEPNKPYKVENVSDKSGYIYPKVKIVCNENGKLELYNKMENRTTIIKNCVKDEIITMDESLNISSSIRSDSQLAKDFNYRFFRIANTYSNKINTIQSSLNCTITIEYNPVIKGISL